MMPGLLLVLFSCRLDDPGPAPARRLTATEYNNTVRDLLGFEVDDEWPVLPDATVGAGMWQTTITWPWDFPAEPTQLGFEGMSEVQTPSALLVESYANAAMHFSGYAHLAPALWMCPPAERDDACAWDSIARFAHRAYRRPLHDDEQNRLRAGFQALLDDVGRDDAVQLSVLALLMAPQTVYRLEYEDTGRKDIVELSQWELASRLSYFLWESMPDAALFEAAASDQLKTPEQLAEQARRMLQDPRADATILHFHEQWLDLDTVYSSRPDMETFADTYVPGLLEVAEEQLIFIEDEWSGAMVGTRKAMRAEAALFLTEEVRESGTLTGLLTSDRGYASWLTADGTRIEFNTAVLYGADGPEGDPLHSDSFHDGKMFFTLDTYATTYPQGQRAGVLTLGASLMGRAHPIHPSPIQRGVFVLERLTCQSLGVPPADAAGQLPSATDALTGTNRERTEAMTAAAECTGCHSAINPVGFAFEHYDTMGAWRSTDNEQPIDASGTLTLSGGEQLSFSDAVSLAEALSQSEQVHDCYSQSWLNVAFGREVSDEEAGVTALKQNFYDNGGDIAELLIQIVQTDQFRTRRAGGQ